MRNLRTILSLLVFALVTVVACSSEKGKQKAPALDYNEADIIFNMTMIPYLDEAVELAALAQDNTQNQKLRSLAQQISNEDAPEIADMTARLVLWDVQGREGDRSEIPGLVTTQEMAALDLAIDDVFDQLWLTLMIAHQREVLALAEAELADGIDNETRQVARRLAGTVPAEIIQMEDLLVT